MKIALIGATGTIGQRILKEAISRGHTVTAILRDPAKLGTADSKITTVVGSVLDSKDITRAVTGSDIVVSAFRPGTGDPAALVAAAKAVIAGLREAHVKRLLIVGGAGSLEVAAGAARRHRRDSRRLEAAGARSSQRSRCLQSDSE